MSRKRIDQKIDLWKMEGKWSKGKRKHCIHCLSAHHGTCADYVQRLKGYISALEEDVKQTEELWEASIKDVLALEKEHSLPKQLPKRTLWRFTLGENVWSAALWIERLFHEFEKAVTSTNFPKGKT